MSPCADLISKIYTNQKVLDLISKIEPASLQDDLKQEMAIVLLNYDCEKLIKINNENNLLPFVLKIIWKMGTLPNGNFYRDYRKKDYDKALEWMKLQIGNKEDNSSVIIAKTILNKKLLSNPNDAHESMLFSKYVELRSCQKVADYFGVPRMHVFQVINKTKEELKKAINNK